MQAHDCLTESSPIVLDDFDVLFWGVRHALSAAGILSTVWEEQKVKRRGKEKRKKRRVGVGGRRPGTSTF